ncbi:MAG: HlyC/CorC family transporter [Akkermansiaceae bacterium]|nr:HlyC/CorC family transporter [Akkermansiaceae bacterium]
MDVPGIWCGGVILAAGGADQGALTVGKTLLYVAGIIFFLLLNAFFVASEFAIVKVRPSQIDAGAGQKPRRSKVARHVVRNLDSYLSANQLGITIASLALGFLGEPFVEALIRPVLLQIAAVPEGAISPISFAIAIISFTFLHVVVGELVPKAIAIRKSLPTTLLLARPLHWFYWICKPAIIVLNGAANFVLRHVFRIDPVQDGEHVHSSEELALLVAESGKQQEVTETEREILENALELNDVFVKDVMTPRSEVVALDLDSDFETNLELATRTKHTRFPLVRSGHFDNAIGLIHIKDILTLVNSEDPDLLRIKRELKVVPETMPLDILLKFFLREKAHLAMVVDEFGDSSGLVFLDNVIEEIVGDIQDEFDNERSAFTRVSDDEFIVEGSITLNELSDHVPQLALASNDVTTVGGYITAQLGQLPEPGEALRIEGYEAKVTSTDGRRVGQVHFRKLDGDAPAEVEGEVEGAA